MYQFISLPLAAAKYCPYILKRQHDIFKLGRWLFHLFTPPFAVVSISNMQEIVGVVEQKTNQPYP